MSVSLVGENVLVLNWRDIGHPEAGGAEVFAWEMAKRLAARGANVTFFTARHVGVSESETRSGVRIIHRGGRFGVYIAAAGHMLRNRRRYSSVFDCQNGIPFFSPVFMSGRCAIVCLIHHVHQEQFRSHFRPATARIGQLLEKDGARIAYRERPLITVSPSTRKDVRLALRMRGPIHVVYSGMTSMTEHRAGRSITPVIAAITRLVPQKRLGLLIAAVPDLLERWPDLVVHIGGTGQELDRLTQMVRERGLEQSVRLHGWVSEDRKRQLLKEAWLTVVPSEAEGWGLTVIEANCAGTPALAFDVPGLRDSIRAGVTGWLVPEGSSLAEGMSAALRELSGTGVCAALP